MKQKRAGRKPAIRLVLMLRAAVRLQPRLPRLRQDPLPRDAILNRRMTAQECCAAVDEW